MDPHDVFITNTALKFALMGLYCMMAWVAAFLRAILRTSVRPRYNPWARWVVLIIANLVSLGALLYGLHSTGITPIEMMRAASLWSPVGLLGRVFAIMYWLLLLWPLLNLVVAPLIVRTNRQDRLEQVRRSVRAARSI